MKETYVLQTDQPLDHALYKSRTLDEWRDNVGKPCIGNSRLVTATSTAFAAPCLYLLTLA